MHRRALACLSVFALTAFAACGGGTATTPPAASTAPTAAASAGATTQASAAATTQASVAAPSAAAAACEKSSGAGTVAASIKNFAFSPATITAKVGDTVTWTNNDTTTHTVTLDDGSCDGGQVAPGAAVTLKFGAAGTYAYHCAIHQSMKGTVTVS